MMEQDQARWTKLVADFETSDLTQREFATERGISYSNLRNWLYKLRKESRPLQPEPAEVPSQAPERAPATEGSRLVPVRVVASASKTRSTVVARGGGEMVELALPSGIRVRFPVGTDLKYLRSLAAAL
jgi:transposase-like protein